MTNFITKIKEYLQRKAVRKRVRKLISIFSCIVVFVTTYALLLPALTLEAETLCGMEEHQHTEQCYEKVLVCGLEETDGHQHTETCFDEEGNLLCGLEESEGHHHDDSCYESVLACGKETHIHTADCYKKPEPESDEEEQMEQDLQEDPQTVDSQEQDSESNETADHPAASENTVNTVEVTAPVQKDKIRFAKYISEYSGIYYLPEDARDDEWKPADSALRDFLEYDEEILLDPEEQVLIHIAYELPAGTINSTNAETEYTIPLLLEMTSEEVKENNKYLNHIYTGNDREDDSRKEAGTYEIKEKRNDQDEVTERKLVIRWNAETCRRNGGEKLTDGTETIHPAKEEGFLELRISAKELLQLEEAENDENGRVLYWEKEIEKRKDLSTIVKVAAEEEEKASPESSVVSYAITADGETYKITVSYDAESGIPSDASLDVKEIAEDSEEYAAYMAEVEAALQAGRKVRMAKLFDITILDGEGNKVEPLTPVRVNIEFVPVEMEEQADVELYHFQADGEMPQVMENVEVLTDETNTVNGVEFETDGFSVYGVIYTVDFHWEANGRIYDFSIPGGGYISFTDIVTNLSIVGEDVQEFVSEIQNIEASASELLWVGKVDSDTTVGSLKEQNNIIVRYSAELTEDQISQINAQTVEAGDWALISLQPFDTEETLTVTMKNGDRFEILVTDAAYDASVKTLENGGTYALVNRSNNNALLSAAHSVPGRLQAVGITVSGNQLITLDDSVPLTKWTFTRVQNQTDQYYIQSSEGYLNMSNTGAVSVSPNRQAFTIQTKNDGRIRIKRTNNNYAINNVDNQTGNGYGGYSSEWDANPGEWFTLYDIGEPEDLPVPGVTIHFVDRTGHEITGVSYTGSNPLVEDNGDGTFTIPYNWNGQTGSVRLNSDFSKSGYTYANSHLAGERPEGSYTYDGLVIDAQLQERNNTLYFYTDCGDQTIPEPKKGNRQYNNLAEYDLNGEFVVPQKAVNETTTVGTTTYVQADTDKDIYVILDPTPPAGVSPSDDEGGEDFDLTDPVYEKKLISNGDGTYTLSLSITGKGKNIAEKPKANVVFVVDTSSSMVTNTVPDTQNTRLKDTQDQLKIFGNELLSANQVPGKDPDTIEVAMVSFDGDTVYELGWTNDYDSLEYKIDNLTVHRGTDWEDGLKEAYSIAADKKAQQPDETTYVVFFTDGEPSNYTNFNGAGEYKTSGAEGGYRYWYSYFLSREASKDEIRAIVNSGIEMYAIFAYNNPASGYQPTGEKGAQLLHNALKYGYNTNQDLENTRFFNVTQTSELNDAFSKILNSILEYADIHDVEVNDNITDLTSVGISSNETGQVTAYTAFKYTRSGGQYGSTEQVWADAPTAVYDSTGVHWDLSSAGVLENGVTYKVSFVVWPSQEAYDWVADLNNDIKNWDDVVEAGLEDHFLRIPDSSRPSGYRYEVRTNPPSIDETTGEIINNRITYTKTHSSIVGSLPDGAQPGVPYEDPETHVVSTYTLNPDGNTYTKLTVLEEERAFGPPDINMGLLDTEFKLEKIWTVNRPEDLVAFLYNTSNRTPLDETKNIDFDIYQSSAEHPDQERKYTTVRLGYNETTQAFDWYGTTQVVHVGEYDYVIGTIWEEPLDIAFGLMLSPEMMAERGLDSSDEKYVPIYASEEDIGSGSAPIYYVLERGHDYRIEEPELDYRFDFDSDVCHPMLVDSFPRDAKIEYIEQTGERTIGILKSISPEGERLDALTAENILRGQLTLRKITLDVEGNPDISDYAHSKTFPITVELYNEDAPFHDDPLKPSQQNVPWYGIQINGEGDFYYYYTIEDGEIRYTDEHEACVDGDYLHGLKPGYYGNIMTGSSDYKTATAVLHVSPRDVWNIANIPGGTQYKVTEGELTNEYTFVKAEEWTIVDDGQQVERVLVNEVTDTQEITGEIHSNHTTEVDITNKKLLVPLDVELVKIDENDLEDVDDPESLSDLKTLPGAGFTLEKYTDKDFRELDSEWGTGGRTVLSDTDEDGRFLIEKLPEGFYKIVETAFPTGYVKSGNDPIFEVRRDASGELHVILLVYDPEKGIIDAENNDGSTVKVRNQSIYVGNTPGASLPDAGGPGTGLFTIIGGLLITFAVLVMKRRGILS